MSISPSDKYAPPPDTVPIHDMLTLHALPDDGVLVAGVASLPCYHMACAKKDKYLSHSIFPRGRQMCWFPEAASVVHLGTCDYCGGRLNDKPRS
jgi:hypothetical protein